MIKRYVAEGIGTFGIVFAPVALSASSSATSSTPGSQVGLVGAALVSGLVVLCMIYALGPISAAHFNPAVTLGFAVIKRFPWKYVAPYIGAQFLGAIIAAALAALMFGPGHGVHVPTDSTLVFKNFLTEVVISFLLMLVIVAVATDSRVSSTAPPIAIGFAVVVGVFVGGPITGGSMNPARSLGPALFGGTSALQQVWLYFAAPPVGAILASLLYEAIRLDHRSARGVPNEIMDALAEVDQEAHPVHLSE